MLFGGLETLPVEERVSGGLTEQSACLRLLAGRGAGGGGQAKDLGQRIEIGNVEVVEHAEYYLRGYREELRLRLWLCRRLRR